jgi:hypothetical protein
VGSFEETQPMPEQGRMQERDRDESEKYLKLAVLRSVKFSHKLFFSN